MASSESKGYYVKRVAKWIFFICIFLAIGIYILSKITTRVTKNVDSYIYNLPYAEGARYKVAQGYGGLFSHRYIAALDFKMPVGSRVFAARGGVIYSYKDDGDEGGPLPKYAKKANYIIIKHDDGSFGCYWHLKKNGVVVKRGAVSKGQLIGYSGNTGFVLRPHLHFSVKRVLNYKMDSFLKTKFKTTEGIIMLKSGEVYERPGD